MTELAPLAQSYAIVNTQGPVIGQPPALITGVEPFTTDTGQFTTLHWSSNSQAAVVFSGGKGVVTTPSGASSSMQQYTPYDVQCPQQFFSIDIDSVSRNPGAGFLAAQVGLFYNGDHNFCFSCDIDDSRNLSSCFISAIFAGTRYFLGVTGAITGPVQRIGFMMCGNAGSGWIDRGSGWECVTLGLAGSYTDLNQLIPPLTGWCPGFAVWSDQPGSVITFDNLTWGFGGGANLRDNILVTMKDGTPYEPSPGVAMFTATIQGTYIGVFTLNTATYEIEQVGVILVHRVSGKWYADSNCHIVLDDSDNSAQVLTATWADGFGGSIQVQKSDLTDWNILSGLTVLEFPTTLALPGQLTGSYGAYDAMMAWDGSEWLIAYSITQSTSFGGDPFYPALASTTDFSSFTLIGADTALAGQGYEGTKLYLVNGDLYVTSGGPVSGSRVARVYDDTFSYLGNLDATFVSGTVLPPHAMPWAMGDSFWLMTFTGDLVASYPFTQGNFVLQQSPRYVTVTVPDVVGEDQATAESDIVAADLIVGDVTTDYSETVPAGDVISQDPAAGSSVASGSAVDLVVSLGPSSAVVPDVVGELQADAETAIEDEGLVVGDVTTEYNDTVPAGHVITQDPVAGSTVDVGSAVDLVVSLGSAPTVTMPNLIGTPLVDANDTLTGVGLVLGAATGVESDTPVGTILSQSVPAGAPVFSGTVITLTYSMGTTFVSVPDVVGMTLEDAVAALEDAGLNQGDVTVVTYGAVAPGLIEFESPPAGALVRLGTRVNMRQTLLTLPFNVDATVISQYAQSPTILALVHNVAEYIDPRADMQQFYNYVWNVNTAQGFGLDVWGRIVGVSRQIRITVDDPIMGFDTGTDPPDWQPMGFGRFARTGGGGGEAVTLDDSAYRTLILTKALANITATTAPALNRLLQNLFPGRGEAYVEDLGGMAMRYVFLFDLTPVELAIVSQSGVLPHPAGVSFTVESGDPS